MHDQKQDQPKNTVNQLGHGSEGVNGVGFVSQGFGSKQAHGEQPDERQASLQRWQAGSDLT